MQEIGLQGQELRLESGWLGLDFANTVEWHASRQPEEQLNSYADLVAWARSVGLINEAAADRLLQAADRRPAEAAAVLEKAIALREAIYHIISNQASGYPPHPNDLALLNAALAQAHRRLRLVADEAGFSWTWAGDPDELDYLLWPVARSAADLLVSPDLERVGVCADERGCGWLFIDSSKNHSRRYCGTGCLNRAKQKRHYARLKEKRSK